MKEPHRIGNDGEAPMDVEPSWSQRLRICSSDLDAAVHSNAAKTEYSVDPYDVDRVGQVLDEIAEEIEAYNRKWGAAF